MGLKRERDRQRESERESDNNDRGKWHQQPSICRCPRHFWFSLHIMENAVTVQKLLSHSHTPLWSYTFYNINGGYIGDAHASMALYGIRSYSK